MVDPFRVSRSSSRWPKVVGLVRVGMDKDLGRQSVVVLSFRDFCPRMRLIVALYEWKKWGKDSRFVVTACHSVDDRIARSLEGCPVAR